MTRVDIRCKDDNTKLQFSKSSNGHYIYSCPYCNKRKVEFNPLVIKIEL